MTILKPIIFAQCPEIIFGFNTILGSRKAPYYFNISYSVGDDAAKVKENRRIFFSAVGLSDNSIAYQKQVHGDLVKYVNSSGNNGESDALITDKINLGIAITTADCTPIFIYDRRNRVIAAVHAGWRGSEKRILEKTLNKLNNDFNSRFSEMLVYIAPSICQKNYEVGSEVAELFDKRYLKLINGKFLLDVAGVNYDMLIKFGVKENNIQRSVLCSYEMNKLLHSYRRDGINSGRSLGILAIKEIK